MAYVSSASGGGPQASAVGPLAPDECVFCAIFAAEASDEEKLVVHAGAEVIVMLNAFPYASGHLMVMPKRHLRRLDELTESEAAELWPTLQKAVSVLEQAYSPEGMNVGLNLGRAAGAGIPAHLHVHAVPRWVGDTNFMTVTASTRVLPEALADSLERLRKSW
jgi:ATP adenylyltransferase